MSRRIACMKGSAVIAVALADCSAAATPTPTPTAPGSASSSAPGPSLTPLPEAAQAWCLAHLGGVGADVLARLAAYPASSAAPS